MSRARQSGFTFLEMAISMAVLASLFLAFGKAFTSASALAAESSAKSLAADEVRRDLLAITSELRGAGYSTLGGFGPVTVTSTLTYQTGTGADASGRTFGPVNTMRWEAVSRDVDGVSSPGRVVLITGGRTTVLAPHVPSGGFTVTRQGRILLVSLRTYASNSQRAVSFEKREASILLRN